MEEDELCSGGSLQLCDDVVSGLVPLGYNVLILDSLLIRFWRKGKQEGWRAQI